MIQYALKVTPEKCMLSQFRNKRSCLRRRLFAVTKFLVSHGPIQAATSKEMLLTIETAMFNPFFAVCFLAAACIT